MARLKDCLPQGLPAQVAERAYTLIALQEALMRLLPDPLRHAVRVRALQEHTLLLAASSGAVAARLKQDCPRLVQAFAARGQGITAIEVRVDPTLTQAAPAGPHKTGLPGTALAGFTTLARQIEPGPLQEALNRLVFRHRR